MKQPTQISDKCLDKMALIGCKKSIWFSDTKDVQMYAAIWGKVTAITEDEIWLNHFLLVPKNQITSLQLCDHRPQEPKMPKSEGLFRDCSTILYLQK